MRRGLADSVERLRKASKSDIPAILDVMRRQAADLAQVRGRERQPPRTEQPYACFSC